MNSFGASTLRRKLEQIAIILGVMVTTLLASAYGQQDVNPTWYDPWAKPSAAIVQSSQPQATGHSPQHKAKSESVSPSAEGTRDASRNLSRVDVTSEKHESTQRNR